MAGLVAGRVALVTGAASGIGRASAELFAREGARAVVVADVDEAGGKETVERIRAAGAEARFERCDVTRDDEVRELVARVVAAYGRLDCAHNNAGTSLGPAPVEEVAPADWRRVLDVNLSSVFYCLRHEIPAMRGSRGGSIVNTASGAGIIGAPGLGPYCASKHGVLGLTKAAALENAARGLRVNAVCPGTTDTPMLREHMALAPAIEAAMRATALRGSFGRPEEVAEAAVWLCSERASWVNGESFVVDGGGISR